MSAPMVLGAEAPFVLQGVLSLLTPTCRCRNNVPATPGAAAPCGHRPGTTVRGYRAPLFEAFAHLSPGDVREVAVAGVRLVGLDEKTLARCATALTALENYYLAIGSLWDARRMSDMRWPIEELLGEFTREHEAAARFRHATMWMGSWNKAFWATPSGSVGQR